MIGVGSMTNRKRWIRPSPTRIGLIAGTVTRRPSVVTKCFRFGEIADHQPSARFRKPQAAGLPDSVGSPDHNRDTAREAQSLGERVA